MVCQLYISYIHSFATVFTAWWMVFQGSPCSMADIQREVFNSRLHILDLVHCSLLPNVPSWIILTKHLLNLSFIQANCGISLFCIQFLLGHWYFNTLLIIYQKENKREKQKTKEDVIVKHIINKIKNTFAQVHQDFGMQKMSVDY